MDKKRTVITGHIGICYQIYTNFSKTKLKSLYIYAQFFYMIAPSEVCPGSSEKASLREREAFLYILRWARSYVKKYELCEAGNVKKSFRNV